MNITVINGPNLDRLGYREPEIYGTQTLENIYDMIRVKAQGLGVSVDFYQSNSEGDLIDYVWQAKDNKSAGIIINPGAYAHYSIALRDAIEGSKLPAIEVHLSNIHAREKFRRKSHIGEVSQGIICGLGPIGYVLALEALVRKLALVRNE